jgi:mannose PTS system EIIC component
VTVLFGYSIFWKVLMVTIAGGIICLDRVTIQAMVSRPVVAGTLTGLLLNDPFTGLMCGAIVELFWIDRLPIGIYVPPNDTVTAILTAAAAIISGHDGTGHSRELSALSALLFLPLGHLAQKMDILLIQSNEQLARDALRDVEAGRLQSISRNHLKALVRSFMWTAGFLFFFLSAGVLFLKGIFPALPAVFVKVLTLTYYFLPLLGVAVALNTVNRRGKTLLFCAAFVTAVMVMEAVRRF